MTSDEDRLDDAKWVFERTLGWIATADSKVGVAVAIDTAMLGGLAAVYTTSAASARTPWADVLALAAVFGMAVAIFCVAMAAVPRMLGPVSSMIFFARVAERTETEYVAEFQRMTKGAFLADLVTQVHRNAQIATAKHQWVRKGLIWSFFSAMPWLAAVLLLMRR